MAANDYPKTHAEYARLLDLKGGETHADVKKQYHKIMKTVAPDKNKLSGWSNSVSADLNEAWRYFDKIFFDGDMKKKVPVPNDSATSPQRDTSARTSKGAPVRKPHGSGPLSTDVREPKSRPAGGSAPPPPPELEPEVAPPPPPPEAETLASEPPPPPRTLKPRRTGYRAGCGTIILVGLAIAVGWNTIKGRITDYHDNLANKDARAVMMVKVKGAFEGVAKETLAKHGSTMTAADFLNASKVCANASNKGTFEELASTMSGLPYVDVHPAEVKVDVSGKEGGKTFNSSKTVDGSVRAFIEPWVPTPEQSDILKQAGITKPVTSAYHDVVGAVYINGEVPVGKPHSNYNPDPSVVEALSKAHSAHQFSSAIADGYVFFVPGQKVVMDGKSQIMTINNKPYTTSQLKAQAAQDTTQKPVPAPAASAAAASAAPKPPQQDAHNMSQWQLMKNAFGFKP